MSDTSALRSLLAKVAAAPASQPAPRAGDRLGRYEIQSVLGEGGFGSVYEARDEELGRLVALKWFRARDDDATPDWLSREARAIARLSHPNIVTLLDQGEHEGRPYLVLELVRGRTLDQILRDGPLSTERAVEIAIGISSALAHAHRLGVVHLDLKPSNIVLGDRDHVTVLDFGLARFLAPIAGASTAMTMSSTASALRGAGTPLFMAPEQHAGDADARTDVFATGILLYAMLTGELPFKLEAAATERALRPSFDTLRAKRPPVPATLVAVLERALAQDRTARHADGSALEAALREAIRQPLRHASRIPLVVAIAASTACIAMGTAWWITRDGDRSSSRDRHDVTMAANTVWTDTGVDVTAGQTLVVHATGTVCTKPDQQCADANGQPRLAEYPEWVLPDLANANVGMLVGRIGKVSFPLGANNTLVAPSTGRLYLGINDRDATDNSGAGFHATLELR